MRKIKVCGRKWSNCPKPRRFLFFSPAPGRKIHVLLSVTVTLFPLFTLAGTSASPLPSSPLANQTRVRLGGPPGGLGYDIRMRPDDPDVMFVTDAFAGIHMSTDGGMTWSPANDGTDGRAGPSGDAIPVLSVTVDPTDNDIVWAGTQTLGVVYRSADGGRAWGKARRRHHRWPRGL